MHLLERYSLSAGSLIDKPEVPTKFYPIPFDKYITFNAASTNMPAKNYAYWGEVIGILLPELKKKGVEIIQLGDGAEPMFPGFHCLNGKTSIAQSAYIVKNAMLHLGVDSMLVHIASAFNIPIVALYSVSPPETCGPTFSENYIALEPNFKDGESYYYNPQGPNVVNSIKVEDIVTAVSKQLDLNPVKIETLHIGGNYLNSIFEIIPSKHIMPANFHPPIVPTIRYDYGGEENDVFVQLQNRKCAIYTDKAINATILSQLKQNLERVVFEIKKTNRGALPEDVKFVKDLLFAGIPFVIVSALSNEELALARLDLSEFAIINSKPTGQRPNVEITNNTFYKTNKIVFVDNKAFMSFEHWRNNQPIMDNNPVGKIIDTPEFWKDMSDFVFVYKKELTV